MQEELCRGVALVSIAVEEGSQRVEQALFARRFVLEKWTQLIFDVRIEFRTTRQRYQKAEQSKPVEN
jgi:hypothetical protein